MTTTNTLLIRADASTKIGTGHVMRCLALVQAWQETGGDACFVLVFHVPALEARLQAEGMRVVHLDAVQPGSEEDATATAVLAQQYQAEWIVVDGYHFDANYQQSLKAAGFRLLFIDDYGHTKHYYADVVLNQNIYAQPELYAHREPYTQLLLGTKYALLRREFWEWREWQRPFPAKARKILVTLGGSDPDNVTLTVIQALQQLSYDDLEAIILVGGQNPHYRELETAVFQNDRIQLRQNATNMPELMAWADLAISAGGSTNWELSFMGLPALIISLAKNQSLIVQHLHDAGTAVSIGSHKSITIKTIKKELQPLVESWERREAMSQRANLLIDGCGSRRIANIFNHSWLTLQPVTSEDSTLIWSWANDPIVRAVSFSTLEIPWESHTKWFANKLADPHCFLYLALNNQHHPIGQARYDVEGEEGVISISIAPEFRGYGYGTQLIQQATQMFFTESGIKIALAYIKKQNKASIHAFTKAGFQEADPAIIDKNKAKQFYITRNI